MKTQGDNKFYHFDCFTCVKCPEKENRIGERPFTRIAGDFVCQKCYKLDHPDKECNICGDVSSWRISFNLNFQNSILMVKLLPWLQIIQSSAVKDNTGNIYHHACFTCAICENELAGQKYINRDAERFCKDCFDKEKAPECCLCGKRIKSDG